MADKTTRIAAILEAKTSQFNAALRRAGGRVTNLAKKVEGASVRMRAALRNTGAGSMAARMKGWGTSIAAFAGVYGLGQAVQQVRDFEDAMADLMIFGKKDNAWGDRARKTILSVSDATGVAKEELATFANKFVELTGNADAAVGSLGQMAKVAAATRSDMGSLAQVMEQLSGGFGLKGAKQITEGMGILAFQALKGSMSFRDIAQSLPQVVGAAGGFGKRAQGIQGLRDVGALFQLGIRGAGTADMTKTAVMRFLTDIKQKQVKLEELTGKEFMEGGEFKSIKDISMILAKAWANADTEGRRKLEGTFEGRGRKVLQQLGLAMRAGWGKQMGTRESAQTIFEAKGAGSKDINAMFQRRMQTPGQQLRRTMARLSNEIYRGLLPAFRGLADIAPALGKALGWTVRNIKALLVVYGAWKASKFFRGLKAAGDAVGGGGLGGGATATMNVRAGVVNVMGGGGVGGGGLRPIDAAGGASYGPKTGPQTPRPASRGARMLGRSASALAGFAGLYGPAALLYQGFSIGGDVADWKRVKKDPTKGSSTFAHGQTKIWNEANLPYMEGGANFIKELAAQVIDKTTGTKDDDSLVRNMASAVERAIRVGMATAQINVNTTSPTTKVNSRAKTRKAGGA